MNSTLYLNFFNLVTWVQKANEASCPSPSWPPFGGREWLRVQQRLRLWTQTCPCLFCWMSTEGREITIRETLQFWCDHIQGSYCLQFLQETQLRLPWTERQWDTSQVSDSYENCQPFPGSLLQPPNPLSLGKEIKGISKISQSKLSACPLLGRSSPTPCSELSSEKPFGVTFLCFYLASFLQTSCRLYLHYSPARQYAFGIGATKSHLAWSFSLQQMLVGAAVFS